MSPPTDIRLSFNEVAETYDRVRPSYPQELFDDLFAGLPPSPEIVEVGPGTGQATADLLARGAHVHAIEIGSAMAAKLRENHPAGRLRVTIGDFESVHVEAVTADAVFSSTAYHWVFPDAQTDRPASILRPGGVVAIVDLIQVDSPDDLGFFAAVGPIYERYGLSFARQAMPTRPDVEPPIGRVLDADDRFGTASVRRYDWNQAYTAADYRMLLTSFSGTQMMRKPERSSFLDDIEACIHHDFDGVITRPLVVTLTTATLA